MRIIDIDECTLGTQGCSTNAICENTIGSYTCTCKSGFEGTGDSCNGWLFLMKKKKKKKKKNNDIILN